MAQFLERAVDRLEEVRLAVVADLHVRVPDDAEEMRAKDLDAWEKQPQVHPDDVLEKRERHARDPRRRGRERDGNEPRQARRQLDARKLGALFVPDDHRKVLAPVRDQRKGMTRIEGERRQQRVDVRAEVRGREPANLLRVVLRLQEPDAVFLELRPQTLLPAGRLLRHHRRGTGADGLQLFGCCEAVYRQRLVTRLLLLEERRDAHHEELVEVRAHDRQELDPLEQGMVREHCLIEHPLIELEPPELAVDIERRVAEVSGRGDLNGTFGIGGHVETVSCGRVAFASAEL